MNADQLFDAVRDHMSEGGAEHLQISADWSQGRTVFGGLSASLGFVAIRTQVPDRVLRSFSCQFIGPLFTETDFEIEVKVLREGKNATQAIASIHQKGEVVVSCQACFGVPRNSGIEILARDSHDMPLADKPGVIPVIPGVTPEFIGHMDLHVVAGGFPFSGSQHSHTHGFMRLKETPQQITDAHVILLIDAWPPTVAQQLKGPAPVSTMTWQLDMIQESVEMPADGWLGYQVDARQAHNGYAHTEANIWDSQGRLLALSRQTVAVFD